VTGFNMIFGYMVVAHFFATLYTYNNCKIIYLILTLQGPFLHFFQHLK